jgi:hypothetical protein
MRLRSNRAHARLQAAAVNDALVSERGRKSKAPGFGTLLLALVVMLSMAAVVSVVSYGVAVALRLTVSPLPAHGGRFAFPDFSQPGAQPG